MNSLIKFTADDLDQSQLNSAIEKQVESIMESPKASRGRSRQVVYESVRQGIIAEQYLIQLCGFKKDPYKYGDVMKDDIKYEVKAFSNPSFLIPQTLNKLKSWKLAGWYHCEKMIVFKVNDNGVYNYENEFEI